METTGLKILLIEPNKKQSEFFSGLLIDLGYQIVRAKSQETAIQKILNYSPDAIICQKHLNEDSGFLFFKLLQNKFSEPKIPFILLLDHFDENDFSLGFEMGVDSFIYPPYEPEKISHILECQLEKSRTGKRDLANQFKSFFETTPFGFFICKNCTIVDTNKLFCKLIKRPEKINGKLELTDIFDFGSNASDEFKLLRCLNGITTYCSFRSVPLRSDSKIKFNIFLNVVKNEVTSLRIAGLVIPEDHNYKHQYNFSELHKKLNFSGGNMKELSGLNDFGNDDFFTRREKQVLKLSAEGAPIKQIAHRMGISVRTVEKHRSNIFRKTNSGNIVEAVFYANRKHLLETN